MLTLQEISSAFYALQDTVSAWAALAESESPTVLWRGQPRKAVSQEIQAAAIALFDLVATPDVEPAAQALVLAIDEFEASFTRWAQDCNRRPEDTDPHGGPNLWNAYHAVKSALKPPVYPRPEPIAALANLQKVNHLQIAKIYGWYDEAGRPDVVKVEEEIQTPGTHYDPKTWVHPSRRRHEAQVAELWKERIAKLGPAKPRREALARPERQPAPESLEDLILAGVNSVQIAKMKKITVEEVRQRAGELGVPLDGNVVADAFYKATKLQEEEAEIQRRTEELRLAKFNDHAELGDDVEGRILAMAADGAPNRDIVKTLRKTFPSLQHQKVAKVIKDAAATEGAAK